MNTCHKNGIAVLMDYVPVHFAVDGYALAQFDGTPTYESQFKDIAFSEWGSCNFDFTKGPVCSFLKSAANYWLTEYHSTGFAWTLSAALSTTWATLPAVRTCAA